jgi:hypothetical protein
LRRPQVEKADALELAAEQGADAGPGDTEVVVGAGIAAKDEGVGEHVADGARLDLGALGRQPDAAPLVPVFEQLAIGGMFHGRPCLSRVQRCPGSGRRGRVFPGDDEEGAGRVPAGGMARTGVCQRVVNVKKWLRWPARMASPSLPAIPHPVAAHPLGRQAIIPRRRGGEQGM